MHAVISEHADWLYISSGPIYHILEHSYATHSVQGRYNQHWRMAKTVAA